MKLFGNKKEGTGDKSSSPVASEKTKQSAGFLKRSVNKIGDILHKKFGSTEKITDTDSMSNAEYLGEIYKLMVQNSVDIKLEREQQVNFREEEDSEEQKRHSEIVKALTIRRRPKPKAVIRREKKAEEKAKEPPKKTGEPPKKPAEPSKPAEPAKKPAEPSKPAEPAKKPAEPAKPAEKAKREVDDGVKKAAEEKAKKDAQEAAKKAAETKAKKEAEEKAKKAAEEKAKKAAEEKAKKETAEKLKKEEQEKLKREAAEKAKSEKLKKDAEPVKPSTATQKPPTPPKSAVSTAEKIGAGAAVIGILSGREALATNISKYESGDKGYNAYNRGDYFLAKKNEGAYLKSNNIDFSKMTIADYLKRTNKKLDAGGKLDASDPNVLFAVGKYQLIPGTMKVMAEKLKLDPDKTYLTPEIQDMLFAKGLTTKGGGGRFAVDDYINGKEGATRDAAILALAMEFASVGVPYDIKAKSLFKNTLPHVDLKKGETFYKTPGGFNAAHNPPEAVGDALDYDRAQKLNKSSTTQSAPANNTGVTINNSSVDNKDMKKQDNPAPINIQQNTTNVNNSNESSNTSKVDDRPAHQRK